MAPNCSAAANAAFHDYPPMKYKRNITGRPPETPEFSVVEQVVTGVIVAHHGIMVDVQLEDGCRRGVRVKRNSGHVVGDDVVIDGELLKQLPRRSELRRRDARGGIHLVAANLDVLGIVLAPGSPSGFMDRAIVAARAAGLQPFLVVNKCDLNETTEILELVQRSYSRSMPVFALSAARLSGLEPLKEFFSHGHRGAFVGTTGVGKSSLLNALCPEIKLKVGEISEHKYQGRHTTTVATLHPLPEGGELVDTPGFRDFGLVDISAEELAEYFPGFEEHGLTDCRFSNCRHRTEPGCSVNELLKSGHIAAERYAAYQEILAEIEATEAETRLKSWHR